MQQLVQAMRAAAIPDAQRVVVGRRRWHKDRALHVEATLPDAMPDWGVAVVLGRVIAESSQTSDVKALRAGLDEPRSEAEVLTCLDERESFTGMRHMFTQSGVPDALGFQFMRIPANGLCVWQLAGLLPARLVARANGATEPVELNATDLARQLHLLCDKSSTLANDPCLSRVLAKLEGQPDCPWSYLSGEAEHYGSVHTVCEELAGALQVHVPLLTLARADDAGHFAVGITYFGVDTAPSIFGDKGGAVVMYEAVRPPRPQDVGSGSLLSHVDLLL